jgi:hypothetical protein
MRKWMSARNAMLYNTIERESTSVFADHLRGQLAPIWEGRALEPAFRPPGQGHQAAGLELGQALLLSRLWKLGQRDQRSHRLAVSQNDDPLTTLGSLQVA